MKTRTLIISTVLLAIFMPPSANAAAKKLGVTEAVLLDALGITARP
jgi:hypothetical protein